MPDVTPSRTIVLAVKRVTRTETSEKAHPIGPPHGARGPSAAAGQRLST
jgi:hypothetical protein